MREMWQHLSIFLFFFVQQHSIPAVVNALSNVFAGRYGLNPISTVSHPFTYTALQEGIAYSLHAKVFKNATHSRFQEEMQKKSRLFFVFNFRFPLQNF